MTNDKFDKQDCINMLKAKSLELINQGESRYPKRSDFADEQIVAIKSLLGPWPRALEKAGLKPEKNK